MCNSLLEGFYIFWMKLNNHYFKYLIISSMLSNFTVLTFPDFTSSIILSYRLIDPGESWTVLSKDRWMVFAASCARNIRTISCNDENPCSLATFLASFFSVFDNGIWRVVVFIYIIITVWVRAVKPKKSPREWMNREKYKKLTYHHW